MDKWEIKEVDKWHSQEYLDNGWEPFGASTSPTGTENIWFRRKVVDWTQKTGE